MLKRDCRCGGVQCTRDSGNNNTTNKMDRKETESENSKSKQKKTAMYLRFTSAIVRNALEQKKNHQIMNIK